MKEMMIESETVLKELLGEEYLHKLDTLAKEKAEEYKNNKPFPHIYIDNFLPAEAAEAALRDFPEPKQLAWSEFNSPNEKKLAFDVVERLPSSVRDVLYFLNSRPMIQFLEVLTGIQGVIPDPYYVGGGLHQIKRGGKLGVHADFNYHTKLKLDRRINLLIYMNKDWKEEYGGHFELWNRDMTCAEQKVLPLFNRCAIFSTTSTSFHGHPTPLACPPDRTRKSIATYYYSNGRPEEEAHEAHSTLFQETPGFKRPVQNAVRRALHAVTPPIIADAIRRVRK
ncbi:MAG: 2OG-Fe(II) oxygenase [Terracidiphilus sp.]|jgi:Rps23 Pro-64 3,4-dihydroxylase Tpa1-like proline 4-hydroxylase